MELSTFRLYTTWHDEMNRRQYDAPADPWRLVDISPAEITYFTNELRLNWGLGRVQGGDWDTDSNHRRMRETTLYRSLKRHFNEDIPWEQTELYQHAAQQIETHGGFRGYKNIEGFREQRCEYIDDLYASIRDDGYRPNKIGGHQQADDNAFEEAYANHLEPLIVIGRSGEMFLTEGSHRFTIASLLELESIPVYVLCRHVEWQRVRDKIACAPSRAVFEDAGVALEHPDLVDITE